MSDALLEAFRHGTWATMELVEFCRNVPAEQLATPGAGTYGSIVDTFDHIVRSEAAYLRRLAGSGPSWIDEERAGPGSEAGRLDADLLRSWIEETEQGWKELLSNPLDADRLILLDEGQYEAHAGVLVAQALNHGNTHREQICAMLTAAGIEPPDVQGWAYGEATGRSWERTPEPS